MKPIVFPKWFERHAHHMLGLAVIAILIGSQCGCAAFQTAALSTVAAVADGRANGAVLMMKADHIEQVNFRKRTFEVKNLPELNKLDAEFHAYTESRDKGLLGIDTLGDALGAAQKLIAAGKFDVSALIKAYADFKVLMSKLKIDLPTLPGGL